METIVLIKKYMATLKNLLDSRQLSSDEYNAIEFGLEMADEELYRYLRAEQDKINMLKETGMLN